MDIEDEDKLKSLIIEIENRCLQEEIDLVMDFAKITDPEAAYNLLMGYRDVWEFTSNVSTSGDSLIVTLPKKEAKERGIKKGTPIFIALKMLRFFKPNQSKKII